MVRLGRALGSDRCSGGTGSASHWAASAVMSSLWPVRVSISTVSWQTRSAAAGSASRSAAAVGRGGRDHGELGHALGDGLVRPLDEAVAVQQDELARGERAARQHRRRAGAQWPGSGPLEVPGLPVHADDQRRGMPAGGVAQRPRGRIEHHEHEGSGAQRRHPSGKGVGPPQHAAEVVLGGEQLGQHGAKLSHRRGGG